MKIGLIFPKDSTSLLTEHPSTFGGASVQMFLLATELTKQGHDVTALTAQFGGRSKRLPFKVAITYDSSESVIRQAISMRAHLTEDQYDVIIQHGLTIFSGAVAAYCRIIGTKFVYMFASDVESNGKYQATLKSCPTFGLLLRYSSLLIVQNKLQCSRIRGRGYQSLILRNGFKIPSRVSSAGRYFLWVGRCDPVKRPELFLDIVRAVPQKKFIMICPKGKDSALYLKTKRKARSLPNVQFVSFVEFSHIGRYFQNAIALINTSEYEGYPQTFIQSLMYGRPIISMNVNPDLALTRNRIGIVEPNLTKLIDAVKLLVHNRSKYNSLSANAYKYTVENHEISTNTKILVRHLRRIK